MADLEDLLKLGALYLAWKAWEGYQQSEPVAKLKEAGASLFDTIHDDSGHKRDLPGKGLTKAQIRALVDHFGFAQPDVAVAIAMAESGGIPNALGDIRDGKPISIGLWQINTRAWPQWSRDELLDPRRNAEAAFAISKGGTDWKHWSTWKTGSYLRYMP